MGQEFTDEIGKSLAARIVLVCVICVALGYGLPKILGWLAHHLAVSWR